MQGMKLYSGSAKALVRMLRMWTLWWGSLPGRGMGTVPGVLGEQ